MITKFNTYILEKSSLTSLGINDFIMKNIQKDFALQDDAKWFTTDRKTEAKNYLNQDKNCILIQLSTNSTKLLVKYLKNDKYIYFVDEYIEFEGEWSSDWKKMKRVFLTKTELIDKIQSHSIYYLLKDGFFTDVILKDRILIKDEIKYNEFYDNFKKDVINNFNSIVKRIWKSKSEEIKKQIIKNLEEDIDSKENIELSKKYDYYKKLQSLEDPYSLKSLQQRDDSLNVIDKKILEFEEDYSKFFKEFLNIKELCDYFTRDKVMNIFFYYLYSGKIFEK